MKKKILLFMLLFIPFMINAEEKCTIISGNGQDIGSEIACGTEHFYIIEDKEDSVRMLAKYNLDIGTVMNKVTVSAERYDEIKELCSGRSYCDLMFEEPEFSGYKYKFAIYDNEDGTRTYMVYYNLESENIKQNSKAIGAHGDERGNPVFPEHGIIDDIARSVEEYDGELYSQAYIDFVVTDKIFYSIENYKNYKLEEYLNYLSNNGISAKNISILSVKEINDIVYKISNLNLPLDEWAENEWESKEGYMSGKGYFLVGSIKEYLPEQGYEWLYSTTYWTRTGDDFKKVTDSFENLYFVDSLGNLCNMDGCNIALGAGIRPVVEISKDSINYNLTTKSDTGGTLETDRSHLVGDTIVLNAIPKTGYKLEKLIVTTESGIEIEVSGEDIVKNDDGTISINPEVFTMPLENVVVEAKWAFVNPKTGVSSFIGTIFTLLLIGVSGFFMIKNCNNSYEL